MLPLDARPALLQHPVASDPHCLLPNCLKPIALRLDPIRPPLPRRSKHDLSLSQNLIPVFHVAGPRAPSPTVEAYHVLRAAVFRRWDHPMRGVILDLPDSTGLVPTADGVKPTLQGWVCRPPHPVLMYSHPHPRHALETGR